MVNTGYAPIWKLELPSRELLPDAFHVKQAIYEEDFLPHASARPTELVSISTIPLADMARRSSGELREQTINFAYEVLLSLLEVIANSVPLHRLSPRSIHWELGGNSTQTFTDVVLAWKTFHRQSSSNLPANVQRDEINDITKAVYFHTIALAQRGDHLYSLFINAWIANIFLLIIERRSGNDVQMIYPARKFAAWMVDLTSNKLYDTLAADHEA